MKGGKKTKVQITFVLENDRYENHLIEGYEMDSQNINFVHFFFFYFISWF